MLNVYKNIYQETIDILKTYPKFIKYETPFNCNCFEKTYIFDYGTFTISNEEKTYLNSLNEAKNNKETFEKYHIIKNDLLFKDFKI